MKSKKLTSLLLVGAMALSMSSSVYASSLFDGARADAYDVVTTSNSTKYYFYNTEIPDLKKDINQIKSEVTDLKDDLQGHLNNANSIGYISGAIASLGGTASTVIVAAGFSVFNLYLNATMDQCTYVINEYDDYLDVLDEIYGEPKVSPLVEISTEVIDDFAGYGFGIFEVNVWPDDLTYRSRRTIEE